MARLSELPRIVIDRREQLEFPFVGYQTVPGTLSAGDYSLEGYESRVAVERKNPSDAYACVGAERKRFTRCLERLAGLDRAAIVIECSLSAFAIPPPRTRIDSRMAVGSYISWSCQYRIPVFFCETRAYAERVTVRFLAAYVKYRGAIACPSPVITSSPLPQVSA